MISPIHCSGFMTLAAVSREMPDAFLLKTVTLEDFVEG
jgi:hypothetical protein